ncbi:MAG: hypothetical protein QGF46_04580 [Planctomycetota bacterium]|nr:hypothetical protein [Planctomycetota bacterium]
MNSTALSFVIDTHLRGLVVAVMLFLQWWTIWFVLGRNFSTTTLLLLVSRVLCLAVLALVLHSGVIGADIALISDFTIIELSFASLLIYLVYFLSDILLLKAVMRRVRIGFTWKRHDLMSFAFANFVYVAGLLAKLISLLIADVT